MSQKPNTSKLQHKTETRRILQRVYKELTAKRRQQNPSKRAFSMTGLGENTIQAIRNGETINLIYKPIDRLVIHEKLMDLYLSKGILPTSRQLFRELGDHLPAHMDIGGFRKLLYDMDYVYIKLYNNDVVVIERPEVTYERVTYLKHILDYFDTMSLPIYFVEEWAFPFNSNSSYGTSNDESGKGKMVFAFSKSSMVFRNSFLPAQGTEAEYKNWIVGELIPTLETKSVIVVNTDYYDTDLFEYPTIDSLKVEMTDWLDRHNVPYGSNMTKIELLTLIKECTDNDSKTTTLDEIIWSYGHIPLRIPRHMQMLTPGKYLYDLIKDEANFFDINLGQDKLREKIDSEMNTLSIKVLSKYVDTCMAKYRALSAQDTAFDKKLDITFQNYSEAVVKREDDIDVDSDINLDSDSD